MGHFSLSWDAYKQNICSGLSGLQQNGELVDMTLAADGHHVKVHQLVMSLVSPYIKDLIASANCPHPIIFLNKISYATLCLILEYIYTGEVLVCKENLIDLIEAGKELHIKGLEEMTAQLPMDRQLAKALAVKKDGRPNTEDHSAHIYMHKTKQDVNENTHVDDSFGDNTDLLMETDQIESDDNLAEKTQRIVSKKKFDESTKYTTSNQGSLQIIINRYIYNLRYTSRNGANRTWRCVDNWCLKTKCPAVVITNKDGIAVRRHGAHNHSFHDLKILKKVQTNAVFSAITVAEAMGHSKKSKRKTVHEDNDNS